jgi:hypothetical protein
MADAAVGCTLNGSPFDGPFFNFTANIPGDGDPRFGGIIDDEITPHDQFVLTANLHVDNAAGLNIRASSVTATVPVPNNATGTPLAFRLTNVVVPLGQYLSPAVSGVFVSGDAGTTLALPPFTWTAEVTSPVVGTLVCPAGPNIVARIVSPPLLTPGTELSSSTATGYAATGPSDGGALSADGRYVAISSLAPDLVAGDTNNEWDVVRHDHVTGANVLVSVGTNGLSGNDRSGLGSGGTASSFISRDGRFVAFDSAATNLVANPMLGRQFGRVHDAFVRDVVNGTTDQVDLLPDGSAGGFISGISDDGRFVSFVSFGGLGSATYLRDRLLKHTETITTGFDTASISGDGRFILLTTAGRVIVRDRSAGIDEVVSVNTDGAPIANSGGEAISRDGRYVSFNAAFDLPGGEREFQTFVRDRTLRTTVVVSIAPDGTRLRCTGQTFMSDDGNVVAFNGSECTGFTYVRDLASGTTRIVPLRSEPEGIYGLSACGNFLTVDDYSVYTAHDMNRNFDVIRIPTGLGGSCGGTATPTRLTTTLTGAGTSGAQVSVLAGTLVSDAATLSGTNAATATGTVVYRVYSDPSCRTSVAQAGTKTVTAGSVPKSDPLALSTPGTYYWQVQYSGDDRNAPSVSICGDEVETVFAANAAGAFVVGDKTAGSLAAGTKINFWGAQWWKNNALTLGTAPAAFKGFTNNPATPSCGIDWSTRPGNSASPPPTLPHQIVVIVTSKATKSGPSIRGNTVHIVLVNVAPGYGPNPGHAGYGTISATLC